MTNDESNEGTRETCAEEAPETSPERVIWQLLPAAAVVDCAVIEDASEEVDEGRDEEDDGEDRARSDAAGLVRLRARAGVM